MELLAFDIMGRMAHFRKIYSTSTSLSYFFPPRTTVIGLIAGLLGLERDRYYEEFLPNKCKIAVSILTPLRKLIQSVNYLNLDEISERSLRGLKKKDPRVPTSIEFIVPELPYREVIYRIFVYHKDLIDELEECLKNKKFAYPPTLGSAYCLAEISPHGPLRMEAKLSYSSNSPIKISTVIKEENVTIFPKGVRVCWESRVPASFLSNRKIDQIHNYFCNPGGKPIKVQIKGEIFRCEGLPHGTYGIFME